MDKPFKVKIYHDKLYNIVVYIDNIKGCLPVASHHIRGNYSQLPKYLYYTLPAEFDILDAVKIGLVNSLLMPHGRLYQLCSLSLNSENSNIRSNYGPQYTRRAFLLALLTIPSGNRTC